MTVRFGESGLREKVNLWRKFNNHGANWWIPQGFSGRMGAMVQAMGRDRHSRVTS